MKLLRLFTLTLLLICAVPALAQETTPEAGDDRRYPLQILEVTPNLAGENLTLTVRGTILNGCTLPKVEILENTEGLVVLDVYSETHENVDCTASPSADEPIEIPLDTTIPPTGLAVDINGLPYLINPDGTFGAAFVAPITVNDLAAAVQGNTLVISVTGEVDGCEAPFIVRQVVEDGAVNVRVYRILSAAMTCPAIALEYTSDIEIPLEGDEAGQWLIEVNGREIGYDFGNGAVTAETDLFRSDAVIESVQVNAVTPLPQQITITVQGYHPDGCVAPVQIRQQLDVPTNTLNIHIYRVLSPAAGCIAEVVNFTRTFPLDVSVFEGATYTINVNGTTVEASF